MHAAVLALRMKGKVLWDVKNTKMCGVHKRNVPFAHGKSKGAPYCSSAKKGCAIVGLARTVYIHRICPYIWYFPCQNHRIYTVYMYVLVLANLTQYQVHNSAHQLSPQLTPTPGCILTRFQSFAQHIIDHYQILASAHQLSPQLIPTPGRILTRFQSFAQHIHFAQPITLHSTSTLHSTFTLHSQSLCTANHFAQHITLHSTSLCTAHHFAQHIHFAQPITLHSQLLCTAHSLKLPRNLVLLTCRLD